MIIKRYVPVNVVVSRHQVAQLVGAPQLDPAAVLLVQDVEVVGLEHLVGELGQAHPSRALQPGLHAVPAQHGAHPEVPPGLRQEVHEAAVVVPAAVVQDGHAAQRRGAVVKKHFVVREDPLEALPDAAAVRLHHVGGQPLPLARLPAWVPDERRGPSEQSDDMMAGAAEVQQADESEQVAHMEAVRRGVEAAVDRLGAGLEQPGKLVLRCVFWERVLQEAALVERQQEAAASGRRAVHFRADCGANMCWSREATRHTPP